MSEAEPEPEPYGLAGLANIGNTCYANSVIQALRVIPSWTALIDRIDLQLNDGPHQKVFLAYQDIARTLWTKASVKGAVCRPMAFWKEIREAVEGTVYDNFRQNSPQDAHEFLVYLLDQCHEALKEPLPASASALDRQLHEQLGGWTSPVVDSLFGWDRLVCECQECGLRSVRYEPFNMLKVGLDRTIEGLVDLAAADRQDEEIEDYVCNGCAPSRTKAVLRRQLWHLPKTFFYVLRRFTADGRKDSSAFHYDGGAVDFEPLFAPEAGANGRKYRPIAAIDHMGSHMGGHYAAQVYHPVLKEWYVFDDERCEKIEKPRFTVMTYIVVMHAEGDS
jgi:ubiquitin C-terminal hydrolase